MRRGTRPSLRVVKEDDDTRRPLRRSKDATRLYCGHACVEVDPKARRVYCVDCGTEVDPYEALDRLAQEVWRYDLSLDSARRAAEEIQRDLANLKRLERNAKARVRKAIVNLPACSCEPPSRYGRFCSTCGGRRD